MLFLMDLNFTIMKTKTSPGDEEPIGGGGTGIPPKKP